MTLSISACFLRSVRRHSRDSSTYFDFYHLPAGVVGNFHGQLIAHVCIRLRQPVVTVASLTIAAYFSPGIAARNGLPGASSWPTASGIRPLPMWRYMAGWIH